MNLLGYLMESRGPANAIRRLASIGTRFGVSQRGMATALDAYLDVTDEFHCTPTLAVTPISGNQELITDGVNGLLVPTRAPEELAKGILSVLTDEPRARSLVQEERRRFQSRFTLGQMVHEYEELYLELWRQKTARRSKPSVHLSPLGHDEARWKEP